MALLRDLNDIFVSTLHRARYRYPTGSIIGKFQCDHLCSRCNAVKALLAVYVTSSCNSCNMSTVAAICEIQIDAMLRRKDIYSPGQKTLVVLFLCRHWPKTEKIAMLLI